jgi:sugar phosphate isomerase/epimerase
MKLGFSAWAMREVPVPRQIEIVASAGYSGIALVAGPDFSLNAETADAAERRRIRALVDRAGLELTAIASLSNMLDADPERRAANRGRVKKTIELAVDLAGPEGIPYVVAQGSGTPESYERDRQEIADLFGEFTRYAGERGAAVILEPHCDTAMNLPERVVWLMGAVDSPYFGLNLDNSHFEVAGCDIEDYIPRLAPYTRHTDLKDQRGRYPHHEFLIPGEGPFDYVRYFQLMDQTGYRGHVTVEISIMVQRRPGYDPAVAANKAYKTLTEAAKRAGVPLAPR